MKRYFTCDRFLRIMGVQRLSIQFNLGQITQYVSGDISGQILTQLIFFFFSKLLHSDPLKIRIVR